MHKKKIIGAILTVLLISFLFSCSNNSDDNDRINQSENSDVSNNENDVSTNESDNLKVEEEYTGEIFLYGETHGIDKIIDKEYELWYEYYHQQGMRHLFIESPYYTAEFLNLWMSSDNNDILDELFVDWRGSPKHNPKYKEFYEKIKMECPETIFHGTDVGHQYASIGQRYLDYLYNHNLMDSYNYKIAKEVMEQGEQFSNSNSSVFRENMMVESFHRELKALTNENIMGIYGAAHTILDINDISDSVPNMATQLSECYDNIYSEDLSILAKQMEPLRTDTIEIEGKEYIAQYYGKMDMNWTNEYKYREYWLLEDAYEDFKNNLITMYVLPESNFPMLIKKGKVYVIDYTEHDGSVVRKYYRTDGFVWEDMASTEEFTLISISKLKEPLNIDTVTVTGNDYTASYYGKHELNGIIGCESIDYWRLEDAYADFKDYPIAESEALSYDFYPFSIETEQVFVIDLYLLDGSVKRIFLRSDGNEWRNKPATDVLIIEDE